MELLTYVGPITASVLSAIFISMYALPREITKLQSIKVNDYKHDIFPRLYYLLTRLNNEIETKYLKTIAEWSGSETEGNAELLEIFKSEETFKLETDTYVYASLELQKLLDNYAEKRAKLVAMLEIRKLDRSVGFSSDDVSNASMLHALTELHSSLEAIRKGIRIELGIEKK